MKKTLISVIAALACAVSAYAVPAAPGFTTVTQPDGSKVTLQLVGDEFLNYQLTSDGYTITQTADGFYVYMQKSGNALVATDVVAHDADSRTPQELELLQSLPKRLVAENAVEKAAASRQEFGSMMKSHTNSVAPKAAEYDYNNFRGLVILAQYSDLAFSRDDANAVFTDLVTKDNYQGVPAASNPDNIEPYTGSVRDYFYDNSLGKFSPQFDVVGPVTINYSKTYIKQTDYAQTVVGAVIDAANDLVDFSQYDSNGDGTVDMFYIIFAGYGSNFGGNNQNYVWPHAWSVSKYVDGVYTGRYACSTEFYGYEPNGVIDGIGTICHEFSHVLGLMDEYDTDYSGGGGQSHDPGDWSVMAGGSYNNKGRTPVGYSALERMQAGFSLPTLISEVGDYSLNPIADAGECYRIESAVKNEFFLFENRRRTAKWDKYLPGDGMLVFRVDSTSTYPWSSNTINSNPSHNYYELVRANPTPGYDSDGDPFPGRGNVTLLTNTTSPANLLSWSGKPTPFTLSNISEDADGIVSFKVENDFSGGVTETFDNMPVTTIDATREGLYADWTLSNAQIDDFGFDKSNGTRSLKIRRNGNVIIGTVHARRIDGLDMKVWNPSLSAKVQLSVMVSTDDGITWTEIYGNNKSQRTTIEAQSKNALVKYSCNAPEQAMFKISSNVNCYIDDVTLYFNDPNGIEINAVEAVKSSVEAPLKVAKQGYEITVSSASDEVIEVYNAAGVLVARSTDATIALPGRGFYIVRQGSASAKISL
ncbi:MAG: M6 family metalloprotease domain-containing protein [Muribaculaceae bacterium]